ncbi:MULTISPECIES: S49 family peptidase [Edwardsiella]|uniref:S49 family peptidase n=2 Tax=Edwardsiella anguillarum TaxID=1821960 RepID=A0ABY8S9W6_9GAMM|nr:MULTISPECIES: S49 family peptidase [Edwardsiella]AKR78011.1 S49 family peptidase [Edwardsiella sp. LADL05-105]KAB0587612.1 S49 family peptidase [Edwardsiella anguillarum]WHP82370.1 S49 family peptidase [Edwardsiella anguillarum]WHP86169.1 S49 family peptidase [Edwardsiella anguillarum]WHP89966.1 S49 family peptidase [Edwardsiella anguillarum]
MNLPHLAQRLFNTPLALHPNKADVIMAAVMDRFGITRIETSLVMEDDDGYGYDDTRGRETRSDLGYDNVAGIAVISICGTLVQKLGSLRPYSGMTGYDGIRQAFLSALADPDVKGICLDIDSPGGEVAGCFDLVDEIYNARGKKPIHAILTENAYSAAYAIASAADRISVPRTGGVGSVGVITMHLDWTQRIKDDGLKVTIVTFGSRKAEGSPYRELSEDALAAIQHDINTMGELFVNTVARNRGISAKIIKNTQAACFMAVDGVELGLADEVCPPDAAFRHLLQVTGD